MYGEQIKVKADNPYPDLQKGPQLLPHAEVNKRLQNSYLFVFIF